MNDIDINYAQFRRLDLNLLVAFDALLQTRHVGRAAERLFIGQPAMSHALARLRALFDDELFVRTGKHMEPTARALELGPRVRAWLHEGENFLLHHEAFDPAQAQGLIRVSIPDGLEALIVPPLMAVLRAKAPGVQLRVQLIEVDQLLSHLDSDDVDLAIVAAALPLRNWHRNMPLLKSGFNYLYSPKQLSLPQRIRLTDLAKLSHVVSSHRGEAASVVDQCFASHGLDRHVVVSSASMVATLRTLRQAPLVSIQPAIYVGLHDLSGLVVAPLKTQPPLRIAIDMVWHARHEQQALHAYVRDQITAIASALSVT